MCRGNQTALWFGKASFSQSSCINPLPLQVPSLMQLMVAGHPDAVAEKVGTALCAGSVCVAIFSHLAPNCRLVTALFFSPACSRRLPLQASSRHHCLTRCAARTSLSRRSTPLYAPASNYFCAMFCPLVVTTTCRLYLFSLICLSISCITFECLCDTIAASAEGPAVAATRAPQCSFCKSRNQS